MKTQPMALLPIAILALLAALPIQAAAQAQPTVDPAADLAADLADVAGILVYDISSRSGMLHVLPGEEQKVLSVLGGTPIGIDKYLVNQGGPPVTIGIAPDLDPTWWTDLINPDDEQVWIFKNRACTEIAPPQIVFCQPDGKGQYTTLSQLPKLQCRRGPDVPPNNYCVENRRVWATRDVWKDKQCTILDHRDTIENFTCVK